MLTVIENAEVFAPERRGRSSLLVAGGRIEAIGAVDARQLERAGTTVDVVDASGLLAIPGLIDAHAHLIGGSGESGFGTQTPEVFARELIAGGITSVVGVIGVDTTTRGMHALIAKVKSLRETGISAFAWSGGYDATATLTGSIRDDIILIDEVIGAGEIAIADLRAHELTPLELARLASECRNAGLFTGKAGLVHLHVGDARGGLGRVRQALESFDVEISSFYPTHVERNEALMNEAIEFAKSGGTVDIDVVEKDLAKWVRLYRDAGAPIERLTVSSDAAITAPDNILKQIVETVRAGVLPIEECIRLATSNPAHVLKLSKKGRVDVGFDADIILLDRDSLEVRNVMARGEWLMREGQIVRNEKWRETSDRRLA